MDEIARNFRRLMTALLARTIDLNQAVIVTAKMRWRAALKKFRQTLHSS
jgi:hypothetical protein